MKELLKAIEIVRKFDIMDFDSCASQFEEYTNQKISPDVIRKFKTCGLSNVDFLTSDFLNQYGYKNLYQYENDKNKEK
jgi:hypothetical protein